VPNRLALTGGIKLEHNYYTGFGVMPGGRATWQINRNHMAWVAVSRAIRTPSAADASMQVNAGGFVGPELPVVLRVVGNPAVENESLTAVEIGYRTQVAERLSVDISAYRNAYDDLLTNEPGVPFLELSPGPPHMVLPLVTTNLMTAEAHGIEVSANWKVNDRWSISPRYAFEQVHARLEPGSEDMRGFSQSAGVTPGQWARLDSHVRITRNLHWDTNATFVGRLTSLKVPSYTRLDTQLSWQVQEKLSFAVVGQNLVRDRHLEFVDPQTGWPSSLMKRAAYAKLTWCF